MYRAETGAWAPLRTPVPPPAQKPAFIDMPVGTGFSPIWNRHRFRVSPGDRLLLITDGVLDTMSPDDRAFDTHGIEDLLNRAVNSVEALAGLLLEALHLHASAEALVHDDVTFFLAEFVDGPPGPALWHVVRNRLLQRFVR